ncbi:hypothetical protein [Ekhidna lutea]|uniref:hypothetical protein n=1 Tax=Ekhidna lutea TaxID=447679 RepID=UPI0015C6505A|nr:hypothetical protein [Ekhidna lutea]
MSKNEKRLLKQLIRNRSGATFIDFLEADWPVGKFDVSTFQQTLSIKVTDDELPIAMHHIVERLNLVKQLEEEGYITLWGKIRTSDNTRTCGTASEGSNTVFLPDISVATEVLKYANYEIGFGASLKEWSKQNFRSKPLMSFRVLVFILIAMLAANLIYQARLIRTRVSHEHEQIVDNNKEVLENQLLSNQIIDSLQRQNNDLMIVTEQVRQNTENLQDIEMFLREQQGAFRNIDAQTRYLREQMHLNQKLLKRSDSLLNRMIE